MKQIKYILVLLVFIFACKATKYSELEDGIYAEIHTSKGDVLLELFSEKVPMTVANFVSLVEGTNSKLPDSLKGKNFYEGIIFHRVVKDFVIQAGGFTAKGRKKLDYVFGDELPKNKDGKLLYEHNDKGVFSMANGGPTTNNSQFFITHRAIPHLDNKHSVFGKTIVNSKELKNLKTVFKDSLKLAKSIDSTRMLVVNKITQNDTINTIKIIRVGTKAAEFNATKIFDEALANFAKTVDQRKLAAAAADKARYQKYLADKKVFLEKMEVSKAIKTASGLRILKLNSTSGKKVVQNKPITTNFTLYVANGKKIQSTYEAGKPFVFQLDDTEKPMIAGFKEGVLQLKEGEKARLFVPYYIGFGKDKFGPFPAKADLVFEIEVLKIGK